MWVVIIQWLLQDSSYIVENTKHNSDVVWNVRMKKILNVVLIFERPLWFLAKGREFICFSILNWAVNDSCIKVMTVA